jgi:hypothetical protein
MSSFGRLRQLQQHLMQPLQPHGAAAASTVEVGEPGAPGVVRTYHPDGDGQGYGPRPSTQPPSFQPSQLEEALAFFQTHRFLIIENALSSGELEFLNDFCERSQEEKREAWQIPKGVSPKGGRWNGGIYLQPLLDHPEL